MSSELSLSVTLGGQGTYVTLRSSNVSYDGSQVFQASVRVINHLALPIGTPDGTTTSGIKVFFHSGPTVTSGTGVVTVANADGTGTFTATNQPYFEYNQILWTGSDSDYKTWQWSVPPTVSTFEFSVYVNAEIPPEQLLVFEVKEGWEPLCRFLECPVPDEPFPRTNDRVEFWERIEGKR